MQDFKEAMALGWNSVPAGTCPFVTLDAKIKATMRGLQSWNDKRVGHVNTQLALAREVQRQLEITNDGRVLSSKEVWLKNSLQKHSLALTSLKWTIARLRSRISWLREGDGNSKLFHLHSHHRKRKNFIAKLISEDQICTSHENKAQVIDAYCEEVLCSNLYGEQTINLNELGVPSFELLGLDTPFTKEVWATIKALPSDKAPGSDGLTGRFYKEFWSLIKQDIMAAIFAIWSTKMMGFSSLNTAYITLPPKKEVAEHPKDFGPISLVHSFAKLVTKILANRLAGKLNEMVSPNQRTFINGRFIQDNFMLVQQTARFLHQQKQPHLLLKLDMEGYNQRYGGT
jgi:hypothetical protein